ncbi:MAG: GIY-YIG nuclease family protein [Clostridia bacterium]|nr:GIY-YIG nuclease family protein [Clostridia bacterium]
MFYVYILTNQTNAVMYIGMTNDLRRRITEHRNEEIDGFTKKYHVKKLVYYERYQNPLSAIAREKQLKHWTRKKKNALIEEHNPMWDDWAEAFVTQI